MADLRFLFFERFRLDTVNECVWCDEQAIQLTPKAFALLRYLAEHAGQLVTKDELLNAVWSEVVVSENVLTTHVGVIRQALGDKAKAPRYIETVHRRGYRFIGKVASSQESVASREKEQQKANGKTIRQTESLRLKASEPPPFSPFSLQPTAYSPSQDSALRTQHSLLVGRETELTQLHCWLEKARTGQRQIGFVTGEAGIGKTSVVEAFLLGIRDWGLGVSTEERRDWRRKGDVSSLSGAKFQRPIPSPQPPIPSPWLGHGQCIEQFGAGEAYLPLLSAFGQLGRGSDHEQVLSVLHQYAPTWLLQLPALVPPSDFEVLQRRTAGATRERMLREMAEALETLTAERALILLLEDLHWSDPSTLELLSFVARRRQPARLLVIGTYRPVEVLANGHPLRAVTQELQLHRHCEELPLRLLSEADITDYLANRLAVGAQHAAPLPELARLIHRRTEGNPLFMVNVVEDLLARGTVDRPEIELSAPMTVRQLIERQFDHLSPAEQHVLEAASVVGIEFSAAAVAAGVEANVAEVETHCADLARREQFLQRSVSNTWPDGTVAACYRFHHALCQEVVYERVTVSRCSIFHQRIGERLEAAYQERAGEIAAELAMHFERGRDYRCALQYLEQAGKNAVQRSAHIEAIRHFTKGLELLKTLPDTPERTQQELSLRLALGSALMATKGWAALEVEHAYARARELCQRVGETPQLAPALWGLQTFYGMKGDFQTARELVEQLMRLAQSTQDLTALILAHRVYGVGSYWQGELTAALEHLEQVRTLYDHQQHGALTFLTVYDSGVHCRGYAAGALWVLGYPDQALTRLNEVLTLARELAHPTSLAYALSWAIPIYQLRREVRMVHEQAEAVIALCTAQGLPFFLASGTIGLGWALVEQGQTEGGMAQIRQGLAAKRAMGAGTEETYWLMLLAEACGKVGQVEEGLAVVAEALALVDKSGLRAFEAELYRLKGELLLAQAGKSQQ